MKTLTIDLERCYGIKRLETLFNFKECRAYILKDSRLKKLLNDELKRMTRTNVVQARAFSEMLEKTLTSYQNRSIESAQVILELINMAKEMRDAPKRGTALGLTDDELAFYDALGNVKELMGDKVLAAITIWSKSSRTTSPSTGRRRKQCERR